MNIYAVQASGRWGEHDSVKFGFIFREGESLAMENQSDLSGSSPSVANGVLSQAHSQCLVPGLASNGQESVARFRRIEA